MELSSLVRSTIFAVVLLFGCIRSDQKMDTERSEEIHPPSLRGESPITYANSSDAPSLDGVLGEHLSGPPGRVIRSREAADRESQPGDDHVSRSIRPNAIVEKESVRPTPVRPVRPAPVHPGTLSPGIPRTLMSKNSVHVKENMSVYVGTLVVVCAVGIAFVCAVIANERSNKAEVPGRPNMKCAIRSSNDCHLRNIPQQPTGGNTQGDRACPNNNDQSAVDDIGLSIVADTYTGSVSPSQSERSNSVDLGHQNVPQTDIW